MGVNVVTEMTRFWSQLRNELDAIDVTSSEAKIERFLDRLVVLRAVEAQTLYVDLEAADDDGDIATAKGTRRWKKVQRLMEKLRLPPTSSTWLAFAHAVGDHLDRSPREVGARLAALPKSDRAEIGQRTKSMRETLSRPPTRGPARPPAAPAVAASPRRRLAGPDVVSEVTQLWSRLRKRMDTLDASSSEKQIGTFTYEVYELRRFERETLYPGLEKVDDGARVTIAEGTRRFEKIVKIIAKAPLRLGERDWRLFADAVIDHLDRSHKEIGARLAALPKETRGALGARLKAARKGK